MVCLIICGKSTECFKIHSVEAAGSSIVDEYMSWGSGMELAYGVLESRFKKGMTKDQAVNLAVEAVHTAIKRDVASGGGIDVIVIDKNGYEKVREIDIPSILKEK